MKFCNLDLSGKETKLKQLQEDFTAIREALPFSKSKESD